MGDGSSGVGFATLSGFISTTFGSGAPGVEGALEGALVIVVPSDQVTIHDNWQAAGLKASGRCDYSLENVFVPDETTFLFTNALIGKNLVGGEALRLGFPALATPFSMGIALGIARQALD